MTKRKRVDRAARLRIRHSSFVIRHSSFVISIPSPHRRTPLLADKAFQNEALALGNGATCSNVRNPIPKTVRSAERMCREMRKHVSIAVPAMRAVGTKSVTTDWIFLITLTKTTSKKSRARSFGKSGRQSERGCILVGGLLRWSLCWHCSGGFGSGRLRNSTHGEDTEWERDKHVYRL